MSSFAVVGITPFHRPDARLAIAVANAGATGVLDLGADRASGLAALAEIVAHGRRRPGARLGVRVHAHAPFTPADLGAETSVVLLDASSDPRAWHSAGAGARRCIACITTVDEALAAQASGFDGVVACGNESGGRIGEESSFVLLQHLRAVLHLPIWVQGGIGLHTAAACAAGGAAGVILDDQLALVRESTVAEEIRGALAAMDGSETTVIAGHRVYARPGLAPVAELAGAGADRVAAALGAGGLQKQLLPVGQSAAMARTLAERFVTAGGVVQAIERSVAEHLRLARELQSFAPDAPLARAHRTRYPIVQGPMTRVSDCAEFAEAVALGGGLPFLALALMRRPEVELLLAQTAARLGDRSWGVGILGFVPAELRAEQMAAIAAARPPFAIIAGGRPAQARGLDAHGTATYLHVPSPGLLELFLKEGGRKFVFEGRESGGHVGPRGSLALWEAQLAVLEEFAHPEELSLLFAGGIHDACSAAMVAALAAPLAARGAKIGVLMGTAYLFTHEAVATGAVLPAYQRVAIDCARTALLETAPGHATRCVETGYVRAFRAEKARLEATGLESRAMWAELEQLNLGRLRIAAKGVRRAGERLVSVDETTQLTEGMYMIGQVAALRDQVTTIAALHHDVCAGAVALLDQTAPATTVPEPTEPPCDIAIIGMAGMFPGAPDLETYWANIVGGVDAVTEVPRERWSSELYFDAAGTAGRTTPSKWGGFLPPIVFDPAAFGIPPRSLAAIEAVQLLSLEAARRALADAGYERRAFARERTMVVFGAEAGTELAGGYGFRAMFPSLCGPLPEALDKALPTLTEDSFPGVLANVIAGRIANRLDLGGMNFTVDAACAASLAAVEVAVRALTTGACDLALVGGADTHNSINDYLLFSSVHALSPRGACRAFDASADGITLGEGVGVVVLKRRVDAERDGDRIHAVIRGIAGASDGRSLGLTAPRKEGQVRALERAWRAAGIDAARVGLIEAHGTGTVVGDRTELDSLLTVLARAPIGGSVLGSVKSQIGHTKCAAGIAALIKTALCLSRGVQTPTLHVERPNQSHDPARSPLCFLERSRPWPAAERIAGVSAFGFGGTNFHAVLTSHDGNEPAAPQEVWPAELFLFRGDDLAAARRGIAALRTRIGDEHPWALRDLARSAAAAGAGPVQVAIVARDRGELEKRLAHAADAGSDGEGVFFRPAQALAGKVAFLFPGQGSQRTGMLADLFVAFPALRDLVELAAPWADRIWPARTFSPGDQALAEAALKDTRVAQPALAVADLAMHRILTGLGVAADMVAGHSFGEVAALAAAGAMSASDAVRLAQERAEVILEAAGKDPGTMAAVSAGAEEITACLAEHMDGELRGLVLANHNAPRQTVVSGPTPVVERAVARLQAAGLATRRLPVACAFHSGVVSGASAAFAARLSAASLSVPRVPVFANMTAAPYPDAPDQVAAVAQLLAAQIEHPVRFSQQIQAMYAAGARVFVEVGPGRVLSDLVDRILDGRERLVVATDAANQPGIPGLLTALARLAVHGIDLDAEALFAGRKAERFALDGPPRALPQLAWWVNGHRAWPAHGQMPAGGLQLLTRPPLDLAAQVGSGSTHPVPATAMSEAERRNASVVEYLRNLREIAEAQRQVMLSWLGTPVPALAAPAAVPTPAIATTPEAGAPAPSPVAAPDGARAPAGASLPIAENLLAIVSERTGYPPDMLGLDADLEGDLSIDSIKRMEILGVLNERLGGLGTETAAMEAVVEQLAAIKTLRGIIEWLEARRAAAASAGTGASAAADAPPAAVSPTAVTADQAALPSSSGVLRYVVRVAEAPNGTSGGAHTAGTNGTAHAPSPLAGRTMALTQDRLGVAALLGRELEAAGVRVRMVGDEADPRTALAGVDGLIDLRSLAGDLGPDAVKRLFALVQEASRARLGCVVAVTGLGGDFGRSASPAPRPGNLGLGGSAGLLKSLAKERPEAHVRVVDLDPGEPPAQLAQQILHEIHAAGGPVEVGYRGGRRRVLRVEAAALADRDATLGLDQHSVVLITGGARGITGRVAALLATRYRCQLELVGRSPAPGAVTIDAELAAASDAIGLRRLLAARHGGAPAAIEERVRRILAEREIRATIAAITAAGGRVRYHAVDVRDASAFGEVIDEIYRTHGRIDGVIHGAGVIEDKLLVDKSPESFDRVFDTKVQGALTLAARLRRDVGFVVFFSSVAGAFGNRGQADYAAANDLLDTLAHRLRGCLDGRVLSVNWGPWDSAGMVSPELRREYERRGIGLIPLDRGSECLLAELGGTADADSQVILMSAVPAAMA